MELIERAKRFLATIDPAIQSAGGSTQTFRAAIALVQDFALTDDQAWPLLLEYNTRCVPPWSERPLRHKLADARKNIDPARLGRLLDRSTSNHQDPIDQWAGIRQLDPAALRDFGVTANRGQVLLPERGPAGEIVGHAKRRADAQPYDLPDHPKQLFENGTHRGLIYSPDRLATGAQANRPLLLCEGWPDALRLATAKARAVIGLPNATPGRRVLRNLQKIVAKHGFTKIVLFPDPGEAGQQFLTQVGKFIASTGVGLSWVMPDGDQDLDARLRQEPDQTAALIEMIDQARPWIDPDAALDPAGQPIGISGEGQDEIRAAIQKIAKRAGPAAERLKEMAATVVAWLHERGNFYFNKDLRNFNTIMYFDSQKKLLLPIQSDLFQAWLADAIALNRIEKPYRFIMAALEDEALSDRAIGIIPSNLWAATTGAYFLSCGPGQIVKIDADGVHLTDNGDSGILFPYGRTLAPWSLTDPIDPFESCAVFRDMAAAAPHGRDLLASWICALPSDQRTKPPLVLSGPVQSGKTKIAKAIYELYGTPERISAVLKHGEGDFWTALASGGLATFDNADTRVDWLADALAAAATGGCQEKRQLYTDQDRIILPARAWVCITSASPSFAADAGLADRLLVVRLNRRQGETAESTLSDEIVANRNASLSWMVQTLHRTLRDTAPVPGGLNARHPDFANLAVRIGRAVGRERQVITALRKAETDKSLFNIENDTTGAALIELTRDKEFAGTAADILQALEKQDRSFEKVSGRALAKRITKIWPHLQTILKARMIKGHGGFFHYTFGTQADPFDDSTTLFDDQPDDQNDYSDAQNGEFALTQNPENAQKSEEKEKSQESFDPDGLPY